MSRRNPNRATNVEIFLDIDADELGLDDLAEDDELSERALNLARQQQPDLQRGDLVIVSDYSNHMQENSDVLIFDGTGLQSLERDHDDRGGEIPYEFLVPTEFPPRYWAPVSNQADGSIDYLYGPGHSEAPDHDNYDAKINSSRFIPVGGQRINHITVDDVFFHTVNDIVPLPRFPTFNVDVVRFLIIPVKARDTVYYYVAQVRRNKDPIDEASFIIDEINDGNIKGFWAMKSFIPGIDPELIIEIWSRDTDYSDIDVYADIYGMNAFLPMEDNPDEPDE
jgi:hypothetical protein